MRRLPAAPCVSELLTDPDSAENTHYAKVVEDQTKAAAALNEVCNARETHYASSMTDHVYRLEV